MLNFVDFLKKGFTISRRLSLKLKMNQNLKIIHLFSGLGAPEKALKKLGFNLDDKKCCEIDKYAYKAYCALHGDTFNFGDITQVREEDIKDNADLLVYGFCCQDISSCGLKEGFAKGSGTRSSLLWEVEKFIRASKPKYLLMENVKNLVSKKFIGQFNNWLSLLEELGYKNYWKVLNAKDYGIPQNRERVFCVSIKKDLNQDFTFPEKQELKLKLQDILEKEVDKKYFWPKDKTLIIVANKEDLNKDFLGTYQFSKSDAFMHGRNRFQYGKSVSDTILTGPKEAVVLKNGIRKMTPLEIFRLMGFDDSDFDKVKEAGISDSQMHKMLGNSIVVPILEGIFKNLLIKEGTL